MRSGEEQEGKCPICNQKITKETGWHVHHIVYRVYGGTDNLSNLLLLHPNCHRQVHHQKLDATKPGTETCPERGLSRMKGQLSSTVLRGLGGSNTSPATRLQGYELREYLLENGIAGAPIAMCAMFPFR